MTKFEEGLKEIEKVCGNGKDNIISLATIKDLNESGQPRPAVRDVDAYYENGIFYVVTWGESHKMQQITQNSEAAFSVNFGGIYGNAVAENLGWVLKPENAEIRTKLRKAFAAWYDIANNEQNENCVILALKITGATLNIDHGAIFYQMDFVNKIATGK